MMDAELLFAILLVIAFAFAPLYSYMYVQPYYYQKTESYLQVYSISNSTNITVPSNAIAILVSKNNDVSVITGNKSVVLENTAVVFPGNYTIVPSASASLIVISNPDKFMQKYREAEESAKSMAMDYAIALALITIASTIIGAFLIAKLERGSPIIYAAVIAIAFAVAVFLPNTYSYIYSCNNGPVAIAYKSLEYLVNHQILYYNNSTIPQIMSIPINNI